MANVSILVQAKDQASGVLRNVSDNIKRTGDESENATPRMSGFKDNIGFFASVGATASVALYGISQGVKEVLKSANKYQAATMGLNSVATAFGQDAQKSKQAAQDLASDGLMTVTEAAGGLKNLLASGYGLDQAIVIMKRFKDTAAFGRQASLGFGESIVSATEGIKNGNSILVDNAGVTKNLSVILEEAGYSAQDLMKATSDAGVRQAIFKGILKESNPMVGDAAKLAGSAAGQQAKMAAQTEVLKQRIGESLQPALVSFLTAVTPIIEKVADWVKQNPELAGGIVIAGGALVGIASIIGGTVTIIGGLLKAYEVFRVGSILHLIAVGTQHTILAGIISSPITMPAIAVGAALLAIASVMDAYQKMRSAVQEATSAKQSFYSENAKLAADMLRIMNDGVSSPEAKARAKKAYDKIIANGEAVAKSDLARGGGGAGGGYAIGTSYASGGRTLVGENGPEIVNLPRGSEVIPAYRTRGEAAQGTGTTNNYLTGTFNFQTAESVQEFFSQLDKTQRLARMGLAS